VSFGIRFCFSRDPSLHYIAHLDMLRLFERTVRRTGLPIAMTNGFNPRMKMIFGMPMSIGLSSESEYADIEMETFIESNVFQHKMNEHLPKGMKVEHAEINHDKENIMARIASAKYMIHFTALEKYTPEAMEVLLDKMLHAENVFVMKKGKKGLREIDIKPLIYSATVHPIHEYYWCLEVFISSGSEDNLRPDLLFDGWVSLIKKEFSIGDVRRTALFASVDNNWVSPIDPMIILPET